MRSTSGYTLISKSAQVAGTMRKRQGGWAPLCGPRLWLLVPAWDEPPKCGVASTPAGFGGGGDGWGGVADFSGCRTEKRNGEEKVDTTMRVKNETQTGLTAEMKIVPPWAWALAGIGLFVAECFFNVVVARQSNAPPAWSRPLLGL